MSLKFHPDAFHFIFGSMDDPPIEMTPSSDGVWRYRPRDASGAAPAFYIIDEITDGKIERNLQKKTTRKRLSESGG